LTDVHDVYQVWIPDVTRFDVHQEIVFPHKAYCLDLPRKDMNTATEEPISEDLLHRFDVSRPSYTSYPTAAIA
jgi:hypothetical protein